MLGRLMKVTGLNLLRIDAYLGLLYGHTPRPSAPARVFARCCTVPIHVTIIFW